MLGDSATTTWNLRWWLAVCLSLLALVGLRLVHLEADNPSGMQSGSMAPFVDEGYKTLGPRNLVLFGRTHWNSQDTYPTWMKRSPLTQWLFVGSFHLLGARVGSARIVTILLFAVFLGGFVLAMRRRSKILPLIAGLALLGLNYPLFFFSRLALFEFPLIVALFGALFAIRRREGGNAQKTFVIVLVLFAVASLGIKASALLYFLPVAAALILHFRRTRTDSLHWPWLVTVGGIVVGVVLYLTRVYWLHRVLNPDFIRPALLNPLTDFSGLLVAASLFCIAHWVACEPKLISEDAYRYCLLALAVMAPVLVAALTRYHLRYYLPILPAYALIVWEWLDLRAWNLQIPRRVSLPRLAVILISLFWACLCLGQALDRVVEVWTGSAIQLPAMAGIADSQRSLRFPVAVVLAGALSLTAWRLRERLFQGRTVAAVILVLIGVSVIQDIAVIGRFFISPSYRSRQIAADLTELVREGESIAGDWAPFFALGTPIPALYLTSSANGPSRIARLRPDYFLFCDSRSGDGRTVRHFLEQATDAKLGPAVFRSEYIGSEVVLYPLSYAPTGAR